MNGGGFLSLVDDEAYKFLENLSESSQQWDFSNCRERSAPAIKKGGLYEVSKDLDIKARLDNLTHKVEALALGRGMKSINQVQSETCFICASPMHTTQICPSTVGFPNFYIEQTNALIIMENHLLVHFQRHTIQIGGTILISHGGKISLPQM